MSRTWGGLAALALAGVLVAAGPAPIASAAPVSDGCNEVSNPRKDLREATFDYSATSFRVSTTGCDRGLGPDGNWLVTVHLTTFTPEVQLIGAYQDLGKYVGWSGFHVCAQSDCTTADSSSGFLTPPGPQVDGPCLYGGITECPGIVTSGYGSWAEVLPSGTVVPDVIAWYADVQLFDPSTRQYSTVADRAPDSGLVSSARNAAPVGSRVTVTLHETPTWQQLGATRRDAGVLKTTSGDPVAERLVRIAPVRYQYDRRESASDAVWFTSYALSRNTAVRACFTGDGMHDPSCTDPYMAYVKAFVSLDLPASSTVTRGHSLLLHGVVRPRGSGQVQVLVREDRPGTTYRLLRYSTLIQDRADSYYRITWAPSVRGRYVLRTRWLGGSTAEGGVLSNISTFRYVTVQ